MVRRVFPLVAVLLACSGGVRRPESAQFLMSGTVYIGGLEKKSEPLANASVTLRSASTGEILASNTTSSSGGYRLSLASSGFSNVVLSIAADGYAPRLQAFSVKPYTETVQSFALEPLEPLECTDETCVSANGDLEWRGPPSGATAKGTSVDLSSKFPVGVPVTDGQFDVVSLAYASISAGQGTFRVRIPIAGWPRLVDTVPNSGTIELSAAVLGVGEAAWHVTTAKLFSEAGLLLPESALDAIQKQTFTPGVIAEFTAVSDAWLAVTAVSKRGCVEGIVAVDSTPVAGALINIPRGAWVSSDAAGRFCVSVPVAADAFTPALQFAGLDYKTGALPMTGAEARCGGTCLSAGTLWIATSAMIQAALCTVSVQVVDVEAAPVRDAVVIGFDDTVAGNSFSAFCGKLGTRCRLTSTTDATGITTLTFPVEAGFSIDATSSALLKSGSIAASGCPKDAVKIVLNRGRTNSEVTTLFVGNSISWVGAPLVNHLLVTNSAGLVTWEIESVNGMNSPVIFGQVPVGAREVKGVTAGVNSGDAVSIESEGTLKNGLQFMVSGNAVRP